MNELFIKVEMILKYIFHGSFCLNNHHPIKGFGTIYHAWEIYNMIYIILDFIKLLCYIIFLNSNNYILFLIYIIITIYIIIKCRKLSSGITIGKYLIYMVLTLCLYSVICELYNTYIMFNLDKIAPIDAYVYMITLYNIKNKD